MGQTLLTEEEIKLWCNSKASTFRVGVCPENTSEETQKPAQMLPLQTGTDSSHTCTGTFVNLLFVENI